MSSPPKHSPKRVYDHSPATLQSISERTPLITKAPSNAYVHNGTSCITNDSDGTSTSVRSSLSCIPSSAAGETDTLLETEAVSHHHHQQQLVENISPLPVHEMAKTEFKILLQYAWPIVLTYTLQNSIQMASLISLGHFGSIELAASSLAIMFAIVTCWSISLGGATALDTLCSQAFTSHHPHTLGLHLQRAILILMILFIPIAGVWIASEYIFLLMGHEPALARFAAMFLWGLLPGAPATLIFECMKKYMQAQGIMHASTYVLLIVSPINAVLNYWLVWNEYVGIGYMGAPLATSISYWLMLFLLMAYIRFVDGYQGWGGWTWDAFTGWREFLKLAIPGAIMVCTERWALAMVSFAASYLGTIALAAQSVVAQLTSLLYAMPIGIAVATTNRVGNLIGKGDHRGVKIASGVSVVLSVTFGMINSLAMILFKDWWGRLFIDDSEVLTTVAMILPLVALFQISDGIAVVGGGVLRGVGLQSLGAHLNLVVYYPVAIPAGYMLTFMLGWGLKGLWWTQCGALWMIGAGELWLIYKMDWKAEVQKCKIRNDLLAKR